MQHINTNNPFLEMGKKKFLEFLDSYGISHIETDEAGEIVYSNESTIPLEQPPRNFCSEASSTYMNTRPEMSLAA